MPWSEPSIAGSARSWHHQPVTTPRTAPSASTPGAKPAPTHPCARCGAPVPIDVGLCERCNPLGLKDSSSSQVHGIAIGGVIAFVLFLAVVGRLALAGVGPFEAAYAGAVSDGTGLAVSITVTNRGTSSGQTTCRVTDPTDRTGATGGYVLSPSIARGETVTFTKHVTGLWTAVRPLAVSCDSQ